MMNKILTLCVISLAIGSAFGVKCYAGVSGNYVYGDCGATANKCLTLLQDGSDVLKACFPIALSSWDGCTSVPTSGLDAILGITSSSSYQYCLCDGDGCNGSSSGTGKAQASAILAVALSLLAIVSMI